MILSENHNNKAKELVFQRRMTNSNGTWTPPAGVTPPPAPSSWQRRIMTVTRRPNQSTVNADKVGYTILINRRAKNIVHEIMPHWHGTERMRFPLWNRCRIGAPQWHNHSLKPASTLTLPSLQSSRALKEQQRRDTVKIHPNGPSIGCTQQACSIPLSTADSYSD